MAGTDADGRTTEVTTEYGLVERATGRRVRVSAQTHSSDHDYEAHCLEDPDSGWPEYVAARPEDATRALAADTFAMNSTPEHPSWGRYRPEDLALVRVETTRVTVPVAFPQLSPAFYGHVEAMEATRDQVGTFDPELAGMLPRGQYRLDVVHRVLGSPEFEEIAGQVVDLNRYGTARRTVVAVLPVPDGHGERVPEGAEAALLVCLPDERPSPIAPYVTWERPSGPTP